MDFKQEETLNYTIGNIDFVVKRKTDANWTQSHSPRRSYILAYACSGQAQYTTHQGVYPVSRGNVLFFKKNQEDTATSHAEDPWTFITIAFDLIPLDDKTPLQFDQIPITTKASYYTEYGTLFEEAYKQWTLQEPGSLLKCRSIIADLLYMLLQEQKHALPIRPQNGTMAFIKNLLIENYNRHYQVSELAAIAKLSNSHFRMFFKQYTGETVLQFQNRLCITKACDLLRSGTCNVTEAAYAVGISDIYYFSRLFKKMTGYSPSQYWQKREH